MNKCPASQDGICRNVIGFGTKCNGYSDKCQLKLHYDNLQRITNRTRESIRSAYGIKGDMDGRRQSVNKEGYGDPTAEKAIRKYNRLPHSKKEELNAICRIAEALGFEIIMIKDKKTREEVMTNARHS